MAEFESRWRDWTPEKSVHDASYPFGGFDGVVPGRFSTEVEHCHDDGLNLI